MDRTSPASPGAVTQEIGEAPLCSVRLADREP